MYSANEAIGGEFALTSQDFARISGMGSAWPEYTGKRSLHCDTGRSALMLAIAHWERLMTRRPEIWLPAFLCPSVPVVLRRCGLTVRFYEDGPVEMHPFLPPAPGQGDLIVVVHYFGHTNHRALEWLSGQKLRDWGVIEDCVQAPYSGSVGIAGEYAVTSLRKWWPAPDGASLHLADEQWNPALEAPDEGFVSRRLIAKLLRPLGSSAEALHLDLTADSEARLDEVSIPRAMSWVSELLLSSVDRAEMNMRRRKNWQTLAASMTRIKGWDSLVRPLYANLSLDAVPLVFPIRVPPLQRAALRSCLAARKIYCPIHWQLQGALPEVTADLAQSVVSLPLDQRFGEVDMLRMADEIVEFFEG